MGVTTLFSFGYWGWGSAVPLLVEAVDAVEASRGYAPPLFVDVRISRSVRARGFDGPAFAHQVGAARYRWMDGLGNLAVREGGEMRIKDPAAADRLLDLGLACARENRRVLFFCACETPGRCHRAVVADLVLAAAQQRREPLEVVEWPGGEPRYDLELELARAEFDKVRRGASSIPLRDRWPLARSAATPWYSLIAVRPDDADAWPTWRLATGPAKFRSGRWVLPVCDAFDGEPDAGIHDAIERARHDQGYARRVSAVDLAT